MNNDLVKERKQSETDAEDKANKFAKKVKDEKNTISSEQAEKRVREILGLPAKP